MTISMTMAIIISMVISMAMGMKKIEIELTMPHYKCQIALPQMEVKTPQG